MRYKFPIQLILFTVLLGLSFAGWFFIDSTKHQVRVGLETIQGDASLLEDKKFSFRYDDNVTSGITVRSDLDVRFSRETPEIRFSSKVNDTNTGRVMYDYYRYTAYSNGDIYSRPAFIGRFSVEAGSFPEEIIIFENDLKSYFQSFLAENDPNGTFEIEFELDSIFKYQTMIEMDGIIYCTIPSAFLDYLSVDATFYTDAGNFFSSRDIPSDLPIYYTAQSGIWAFDTTNQSNLMENVVPYKITGPTGPEVCGIYAIESERSIVLVTVENGTDLYVTIYNTITKTLQEPVLIFHSDSGVIDPYILHPNETCKMGSFYILISDIQGGNPNAAYAVCLNKDIASGSFDSESYRAIVFERAYYSLHDLSIPNGSYPHIRGDGTVLSEYSELLYPEVYYVKDELWIISHDKWNELPPSPLISENLLNPLYSGTLFHKYHIQVFSEGILQYEGILTVDLPINPLQERVKYGVYAYNWATDEDVSGYQIYAISSSISTWISMTVE